MGLGGPFMVKLLIVLAGSFAFAQSYAPEPILARLAPRPGFDGTCYPHHTCLGTPIGQVGDYRSCSANAYSFREKASGACYRIR